MSGGESLGEAEPSEKQCGVEGRFVGEAAPSEKQSAAEGGFVGRNMSIAFI